jgi:hypothetical protein
MAGSVYVGFNIRKKVDSREVISTEWVVVSKTEDYIKIINPRIDPDIRKLIAKAVDEECVEFDLDPEVVVSLIQRESEFKPWAVSTDKKTGLPIAYGLMQIHYKVHTDVNSKYTINQICEIRNNIHEGCRILKGYITSTGDMNVALGKYVNSQGFSSYKKDILSQAAVLYAMR